MYIPIVDKISEWFSNLSNEILLAITSSILSSVLTKNWTRYQVLYYNIFFPKELKFLIITHSLYNNSVSTRIDINKKYYNSHQIYDICKYLLKANKWFYKQYNGLEYNYYYIKKLFEQSWHNVLQYISLNNDVLKDDELKDKLNNIIKNLEKFNINLPIQYKYITSSNTEILKQCYIFAHKQFVKNNIDKIINYQNAQFIENWLKNNRVDGRHKYCIRTYYCYFSWDVIIDSKTGAHFANAEISREVITEILSLYLSNCEKLKEMKERYKYILRNIHSSFNSVVESMDSQLEMYKSYKNNPSKFDKMLASFCTINKHNIDKKLENALYYDNKYNRMYKQFRILNKILNRLIFESNN